MIRTLRGKTILRGKDYLIVDVGGVAGGIGLKVFVPEPTSLQHNTGSELSLHTYLQVREDALTLFGFASEDELSMFELLIGVSGVGPKMAMSVLSTLSTDALRLSLVNEEPGVLSRVSGIGKRTAEKIIVELKGKVKGTEYGFSGLVQMIDSDTEVVEALIALGYSVVEAQRAVQALPKDVSGVEERLRLALSKFGG